MTAAVTLNGHACAPGTRVQVGSWGAWWADLNLTEAVDLSGAAAIEFAGVSMSGTIVAGGTANGRAAYNVVGGRGGWGREIPRKAYNADNGVKVSKVVGDAASAAGETVEGVPTTRLGPHFARPAAPASHTLHAVTRESWRVDFDGVTRFGARAVTSYAGDGTRVKVDPGFSFVDLAVDTVAGLLPGVTIDGSAPASDVEYELGAERITVRVYAGRGTTPRARRLAAQRRIFDALFPELRYAGAYEYRVVSQSSERLNLQIVRTGTGLPDLARVPVRPGMAGLRATVTPGSLVLVTFIDRDPSRPAAFAHDAPDAPGWMPLTLELGGPGALGVALIGSVTSCPAGAGTVTTGSVRVKAVL